MRRISLKREALSCLSVFRTPISRMPSPLMSALRRASVRRSVSGAALSLAVLTATALACLPAVSHADGAAPDGARPDTGSPAYIAEDPALGALIGRDAPSLSFTSLEGQTVDLEGIYGRKPVYLKLWATYCIPCRAQMPGFETLYRTYGDRLSVVAVDIGFGETRQKVAAFVKRTGLTMPVVIDDGRLGNWLGIRATPLHVLIDRNGRIAYAGHQDGPALIAAIDRVIAQPRSAAPRHLPSPDPARVLSMGESVPAFTAGGDQFMLVSDHATRPQALYFSAPWCETYLQDLEPETAKSCRDMRLKAQKSALSGTIAWKAVTARLWTEPGDLPPYQAVLGSGIPLVPDQDGTIFSRFGIRRIPAIALIDKTGHLRAMIDSADPRADSRIAAFARVN